MFRSTLRYLGIIASFAVLNPAPGQVPPVDVESAGGFDASEVLRSPTPIVVGTLALDMRRTITTQTQLIRYEATAYQRKVAEQRARAYMSAQRRAQAQTATASKPAKTSKPSEAPKTASKKTTKKAEPEVAVLPKKKVSRYVAVDTVKDERASPKAKKVVMIFDTQSETLVGNRLYDLESPPSVGSTAKFETYSAEYIGTGL